VNAKQALAAACAKTGDKVEAVLSHRLTESEIIFVVDRGIKGCPKFSFDLTDLEPPQPDPPVAKDKPEAAAKPKARPARRSTKK